MDSGSDRWLLGRRDALDGVRGLAVLMVLAAHFGIPRVNSTSLGTAGVTAFFTLSGFLITALLLEERERRGPIARGRFYLRRALRLGPAMLACVVLAIALELVTLGRVPDWDLVIATLTYTANFAMIDGQWGEPTFLGHTWSLGIEEQFYLVWPFALATLCRFTRRQIILVLGYAAMAAVVLRHVLWSSEDDKVRLWMGLDTRADALLIGCLLAFVVTNRGTFRASHWWPVAGVVMLGSTVPWQLNPSPEDTAVLTPVCAAVATAFVIYGAAGRDPLGFLAWRPLRHVGLRSYGLYLYHVPILTALEVAAGEHSMTSAWLVALPASLVAAEVSWFAIERPLLALKTRIVAAPARADDRRPAQEEEAAA